MPGHLLYSVIQDYFYAAHTVHDAHSHKPSFRYFANVSAVTSD
ncbi:hypothetical protein J502_1078 [Acinetobacter sp. 1294596]|nr:hypothetical protein J502_1078 [Acinetobacter sp. 1294596]